MPSVEVYNIKGEQVGELELSATVFAAKVNENLLYDVAQMLLAARRRGTANTKTRGEVRGGGRKPWRQKGTGRARHGSIRSPIWVGGGTTFGPKPRSYRYTMPQKMRRAALLAALTSKLNSKQLVVVDELKLNAPRAKEIISMLDNLQVKGSVLLVTAGSDLNVYKSCRNLADVTTAVAHQINVLSLLSSETLVLTKEAVAKIEEVFAGEKSA